MKIQTITTPIVSHLKNMSFIRPDEPIRVKTVERPSKFVVDSAKEYFSPTTLVPVVKDSVSKTAEVINFVF